MARHFRIFPRLLLALSASSVVAASSAPGRADDAAEARESARALADEAANAYARGDFLRAHELLERAHAILPAPTIAVLDARALTALGRLLDAAEAYRRAASHEVAANAPPAFTRAKDDAASELRALEHRIPRLSIELREGSPSALTRLLLDGQPIQADRLGKPIPLDPKTHSVRAEFEGHGAVTQNVALAEREHKTVFVEAPRQSSNAARTWSFVGFGVGAAGLATGLLTGSMAISARDDALRRCPERRCEAGSAGADALDRFRTYRTISTVGYALGALGVGFGTVMLVTRPEQRKPTLSVAASFDGLRLEGTL